MKRILILHGLLVALISCDSKIEPGLSSKANFLDAGDRVGLWINAGRSDTLYFVNNIELKRRVPFDGDYFYRIENDILYVALTGSGETQHPILEVTEGSVKLNNMYPTIGFLDNSGTFLKK